jgi:hypothetical protein
MKSTDLNPQLTANALNENMYKQFNVKINFDKYTREQLENARNILRTKTGSLESTANFNDLLTNETYQKDKYMLGVLNTKIKEMLGEGKKKDNEYAIGMAAAKKSAGITKKHAKDLPKSVITKGHEIAKKIKKGEKTTEAVDQDGNNENDFDDVQIARYTAGGMPKKKAIAKAHADKNESAGKCYCAAKGKSKCPVHSKMTEAKKPDANKDGIPDYAQDGKGPKDLGKGNAGKKTTGKKGMSAKQQKFFGKKKAVKESELKHRAYQQFIAEGIATYIAEDEEGKAKSITAAADMVNDFTSWMQRVGNYQTKSMIELADNIRANFGMQEAEQFKQSVAGALEGALAALTSAREEINNAVAVLAGEAPAEEQMGMDDSMDTGMEQEPGMDDMNPAPDEFASADPAAGAPNELGRMKRESIERGNRLMRILGS